jgi:hypothetical protein
MQPNKNAIGMFSRRKYWLNSLDVLSGQTVEEQMKKFCLLMQPMLGPQLKWRKLLEKSWAGGYFHLR